MNDHLTLPLLLGTPSFERSQIGSVCNQHAYRHRVISRSPVVTSVTSVAGGLPDRPLLIQRHLAHPRSTSMQGLDRTLLRSRCRFLGNQGLLYLYGQCYRHLTSFKPFSLSHLIQCSETVTSVSTYPIVNIPPASWEFRSTSALASNFTRIFGLVPASVSPRLCPYRLSRLGVHRPFCLLGPHTYLTGGHSPACSCTTNLRHYKRLTS